VGAKLEIYDENGMSIVDLESIYTGDGIKPRNISDTAIIKNIILPLDRQYKITFDKLRPREAVDFTSLTIAVSLDERDHLRIVIGGADPKPVVVTGTADGDKEEYIKLALKKCRVIDNDYYSRSYRREMMRLFLEQSFAQLLK
jgi:CO/xanthine dehydrogenase FAD-binding subunit